MKLTKVQYYLLSFTWGLPMTLIGVIVAAVLMIAGHRPKPWGYGWYFEIGNGWGGVNLGVVFITAKNAPDHTRNHEFGHSVQNCKYGLLMPFIVCIPSATRYWYREIRSRMGLGNKTAYGDIWFEREATEIGDSYFQ